MGVDFAVGRPTPTLEEDFAAVEAAFPVPVDSEPPPSEGRAALARIKRRVEEELGLRSEAWDYVEGPEGAHFAYSSFHRFRVDVAKAEGVDLEVMYGFWPGDDHEAHRKLLDRGVAAPVEGAQRRFIDELGKNWDEVDTKLEPFLHHSDCDDEMTPAECAQVAPRLGAIVEGLEDEWNREAGRKLVAQMEHCAENDLHLLFR